jgi:hypothetical protein
VSVNTSRDMKLGKWKKYWSFYKRVKLCTHLLIRCCFWMSFLLMCMGMSLGLSA